MKQQRAEEHPRAFETASRRCTERTEGQKDRRTEGQIDQRSRCTTRTGGRKDTRTEGQKDRRTEGPIDKQSRCTTRTGGRKDIRTEGRKHRRTEAQIDRSTDRQTDTPTNGHTENNPRNGQPENRTSGPTTRAMPRGAELPCPRSRRPPSHCPAAVHEVSREPAKVRVDYPCRGTSSTAVERAIFLFSSLDSPLDLVTISTTTASVGRGIPIHPRRAPRSMSQSTSAARPMALLLPGVS